MNTRTAATASVCRAVTTAALRGAVARRVPCRRITLVALVIAGGCAGPTTYPSDWTPVALDDAWCRQPSGSFANDPVGSSDAAAAEAPLPLAEVFFGPLLRGFEVTHIRFDTLEDGELRVRPWVGETELQEVRVIKPAAKRCGRERWLVKSGWEAHPYGTASIAFWSFGTVLPVASQGYFSLQRNAAGQLTVHAVARTTGIALYFIPFRTRLADSWYAYAAHPGTESTHVE
jgi:hypothetical protein